MEICQLLGSNYLLSDKSNASQNNLKLNKTTATLTSNCNGE